MTQMEIVGLGSALVDVLAHVTDEFIEGQAAAGMQKGTMALIDEKRAEALYDLLPPAIESSGGSVANTLAGFASLGGRGAFVGKIAEDQLGRVFAHDMRAMGVAFDTAPLTHGAATGRSLVLITPDAQRTMNTFLGAAREMGAEDVPLDTVRGAAVTLIEGYLFDSPGPTAAAHAAVEAAKAAGRRVAVTLCDPLCVGRHRATFRALLDEGSADIILCNEDEVRALYETEDLDAAIGALPCPIAAVTRSARGAIVVDKGRSQAIAAVPDVAVVDSTGAGDAFAAGFLFGVVRAMPLLEAGRLGVRAAARVITTVGARADAPLTEVLKG
jgi:sugar/nucleoside kinase (ribokinase family)